MNEHVFALDIGTQSVTGILLEKVQKEYKIIDFCVRHHQERSMLDGQIQNVVQVADVISEVKEQLEKNNGPLTKVCVAAAGRALKTIQTEKTIDINEQPITTEEEIKHLELSAVQQALVNLTEQNKNQFSHYHCVGYSLLHYKLDGEKIGSFIDQIGEKATVEIIATFLPKVVVESLIAALERANLTMEALTLEPIAAIHVLVPESMRRLNVALIDIGAGTSDIAISNNGTVIAYGMVPTAGDEITEAISDEYLLDFKVAEETKQQLVNTGQATIHDILGFESEITLEDVVPKIENSIDQLASLLAQEIRLLNGKAPQAVMLIGGGSLTPEIHTKIAEHLQLPSNRVAVRSIEAIQHLQHNEQLPTGPEFVTPIGIAISATQNPLHYLSVYVNDKITFMFETKQLTVGDALIQAGIDVNKYYGRIGLASIVTVNEKTVTLRGGYGELPKITVNDEEASVSSFIKSGDRIAIMKGQDGKHPELTIEDIIGDMRVVHFFFNQKSVSLTPKYIVNGKKATKDYIVQDKDDIIVEMPTTINEFLNNEQILISSDSFSVRVNNRKVDVSRGKTVIMMNGKPVTGLEIIKEADKLELVHPERVTVNSLLEQLDKQLWKTHTIFFNGEPVVLKQPQLIIQRQGEELNEESELKNGDELILTEKKTRQFIFQDVFRYIDINLTNTKGTYKLYRNNEATNFNEPIIEGDQLEIIWE
ncbi:pilus assembly protein PilM [Pseudogracilibacillus sp. SE30717A]|uniref:cell division protein FtsA n=1 Tax=Pseudogracilibacillus sp. SE30717A TaxID=3098293 RepID=UPI00300E1562